MYAFGQAGTDAASVGALVTAFITVVMVLRALNAGDTKRRMRRAEKAARRVTKKVYENLRSCR